MRELRGIRSGDVEELAEMSPTESLSLRVLGNLAMTINSRQGLESFEIIPIENNQNNKSPIVLVGANLGLESWCVKHIYNYAYKKLMDEYISKKNPKKIDQTNVDLVNAFLMGVLLINPDIATLWNKRKEMVVNKLLLYTRELKFTKIVLSHKFKCNEVFAYRKWLILRYFCELNIPILHGINDELNLINICVEKCSSNYHAWSHRIWLMKHTPINSMDSVIKNEVYSSELEESEKWFRSHVSDYSGLHYRQFCIKNLMSPEVYHVSYDNLRQKQYVDALNDFFASNLPNIELPQIRGDFNAQKFANLVLGSVMKNDENKYQRICSNMSLLARELKMNEDKVSFYSSHESLWCFRRFVSHEIIDLIFDYFGENKPKPNNSYSRLNERHLNSGSSGNIISTFRDMQKNTIDDPVIFGKEPKISKCDNHAIYSSLLYKALVTNEKRFIEDRSKAGDPFAKRYESWLRLVLNICI